MQKSLHSADYQHFLAELREARERAGLTQEELAARLHEHQTFISKCERGVRRLDIVELRSWMTALGSGLPEFTTRLEQRWGRHKSPSRPRSTPR